MRLRALLCILVLVIAVQVLAISSSLCEEPPQKPRYPANPQWGIVVNHSNVPVLIHVQRSGDRYEVYEIPKGDRLIVPAGTVKVSAVPAEFLDEGVTMDVGVFTFDGDIARDVVGITEIGGKYRFKAPTDHIPDKHVPDDPAWIVTPGARRPKPPETDADVITAPDRTSESPTEQEHAAYVEEVLGRLRESYEKHKARLTEIDPNSEEAKAIRRALPILEQEIEEIVASQKAGEGKEGAGSKEEEDESFGFIIVDSGGPKAEPKLGWKIVDSPEGRPASDGRFEGYVFYLPEGRSQMPKFETMTPVAGPIHTQSINVPQQSYNNGFPGVPGRKEWFALRYTGVFTVGKAKAGKAGFRLYSDDGSQLFIDDRMIIDNTPGYRSTGGHIDLAPGRHRIRVDFYQGPGGGVGLQLFCTPPGGEEAIFDFTNFMGKRQKKARASVIVRAHIDGKSHLCLQGSDIWWHHYTQAAPGRSNGGNEPTLIEFEAWYPQWPAEGDSGTSSHYTTLYPPVASSRGPVDVTTMEGRGTVVAVQHPSRANKYTVIVEFDDTAHPGAAWYQVNIEYTYVVEKK